MTAAYSEEVQLGEAGLLRFVAGRNLDAELVRPGAPTPTVVAAAEALGTDVGAVVKSLLFLADGDPWLVIASGESRVATKLLAAALGVSRRRLRFATPDQALDISGYAVGAMPPFGHRRPLPTLIDSISVPHAGTVYGGGGSRDALLRLSVATLHAVTGGCLAPLTEGPS